MRTLFLIACISISLNTPVKGQHADAPALEWHTDLLKANEIAAKNNKPIFAFFTGSDWCYWCKKIQADVFSKPSFIDWAKKNVVLLELDFPRSKQLPQELAQQNQGLQQTFGVMGYPTIWLFNMSKKDSANNFNIEPYGSLGYPPGAEVGKEEIKFLNEAYTILSKKKG